MRLFANLFSKKKDIEIQSITYGLNLFIPTFILIISSLFKNYELTAEIGILIGVNIIFTQIFSSNARSIIISQISPIPIQSFILFRILISFFIIISNLFILHKFDFIYINILIQLSILIILQWLNELVLTFFEINKKKNEIKLYLFIKLIFLTGIIINFIFFDLLFLILLIFNLIILLFFLKYYFLMKKDISNKEKLIKIMKNSLSSSSFFSSFSISFANLLWRIFIIIFCGKITAGIYFAGFAIGSLPGTFFNNTFGPSVIKNDYKFEKLKKLFNYSFVICILSVFVYITQTYDNIFVINLDTQIACGFFSLIGSFFMVKGLYFRQYLIQKTRHQLQVFKVDVIYSIFIVSVVPILFLIGNYKLVILSFLFSSIISFVTYGLTYQLCFKK